jgi:hypothetical protein
VDPVTKQPVSGLTEVAFLVPRGGGAGGGGDRLGFGLQGLVLLGPTKCMSVCLGGVLSFSLVKEGPVTKQPVSCLEGFWGGGPVSCLEGCMFSGDCLCVLGGAVERFC